jgi:hypothetical protein
MAEVVCLGELLIDFVPAGAGDDPARSDTYRRAAVARPRMSQPGWRASAPPVPLWDKWAMTCSADFSRPH